MLLSFNLSVQYDFDFLFIIFALRFAVMGWVFLSIFRRAAQRASQNYMRLFYLWAVYNPCSDVLCFIVHTFSIKLKLENSDPMTKAVLLNKSTGKKKVLV